MDNGNEAMSTILIKAGADVNKAPDSGMSAGQTPLYRAVENDNEAMVKALIEAGADVNKAPFSGFFAGQTPLHKAVERGYEAVAKALIEAGADVNKAPDSGFLAEQTPRSMAAENGNDALVHALIEAGADVNKAGGDASTPLQTDDQFYRSATSQPQRDAGMKAGSDFAVGAGGAFNFCGGNIPSSFTFGQAELHEAAQGDQEASAKELIEAGADTKKASDSGSSADQVNKAPAVKTNWQDIADSIYGLE
jgi:ankyrin repeat protein